MEDDSSGEDRTEPQKLITREQLYSEVWAEPLTKVAARHRTYLNILAKACQRLNVPRPPQGYWARRAAGKTTTKPPLPEALPGDELTWLRGGYAPAAEPLPEPVRPSKRPKARLTVHPLVVDSRKAFGDAETTDVGYLKPSVKSRPNFPLSSHRNFPPSRCDVRTSSRSPSSVSSSPSASLQ